LNTSYINLENSPVDPEAISFVPESIAKEYLVLPYKYDSEKQILYIAAADPYNTSVSEFLERKPEKTIFGRKK